MVSALQRAGGVMDSGADPDISGAAADVAVHGEIDVAVGRLLDLAQQSDGANDLTRLAVAALRNVARDPGPLHGVGFASGNAFYRRHLATAERRDGQRAGPRRLPIQKDGARAALGDTAAEFGAHQTQRVAEHPQQRSIGEHIDTVDLSVNLHIECRHRTPPYLSLRSEGRGFARITSLRDRHQFEDMPVPVLEVEPAAVTPIVEPAVIKAPGRAAERKASLFDPAPRSRRIRHR